MEQITDNTSKHTRVQLELPQRSFDRLKALKEKTEAASYSEVLKNALRLYESMIDQHEDGKRLYVKEKDGALVAYEIFF